MRSLDRIGIGAGLVLAASAGCSLVLGIEDVTQRQGTGGTGGLGGTSSSSGTGGAATSSSSGSTGGNPTTSSSSSGTGGNPECGPITGKGTRNQVDLTTTVNSEPIDYSNAANVPQALVQSSPGQFSAPYPATGKADGTFEIDGVPCGPYFLDFGSRGYWLTNRSGVDFSTYQTNDLDAAPLVDTPQVHLVVDNMTPWVDGDVLELIDPNSAAYAFDQVNGVLLPSWMAGDTHIDATGDWINWVFGITAPVVASSTVSVFHGGVQAGHTYTTIQDFATVSFATPNGADAGSPTFDVTVDFQPVTHVSGGFKLNLNATPFEDAAKNWNPRATPVSTGVDYQAHPGKLGHGQLIGTADSAFENVPAPAGMIDKTYSYGNPFQNWTLVVGFTSVHSLMYQLPGATPVDGQYYPLNPFFCDMAPDDPALIDPAKPFVPPIAAPANPKIDAASFWSPTSIPTLGSLDPTISWDAPPAPAQVYEVRIYPVVVSNGNTRLRPNLVTVVRVGGDATSFVVPPGYLQPSTYYVIVLTGITAATLDYQHTPNGSIVPYCMASATSDIVQTPAQ